ncbi:MAG: hypothetical protein HC836_42515 [Richelia sp. RM2_1_2]|nr:hypothetical protein [Richelia sp. SM2_1_7]NJM21768.1 hypothetical protein [Richelia sp. SM1_7_0]NJO64583.1 hypothetical protein [Richelia sp. RM2_1_2]
MASYAKTFNNQKFRMGCVISQQSGDSSLRETFVVMDMSYGELSREIKRSATTPFGLLTN